MRVMSRRVEISVGSTPQPPSSLRGQAGEHAEGSAVDAFRRRQVDQHGTQVVVLEQAVDVFVERGAEAEPHVAHQFQQASAVAVGDQDAANAHRYASRSTTRQVMSSSPGPSVMPMSAPDPGDVRRFRGRAIDQPFFLGRQAVLVHRVEHAVGKRNQTVAWIERRGGDVVFHVLEQAHGFARRFQVARMARPRVDRMRKMPGIGERDRVFLHVHDADEHRDVLAEALVEQFLIQRRKNFAWVVQHGRMVFAAQATKEVLEDDGDERA